VTATTESGDDGVLGAGQDRDAAPDLQVAHPDAGPDLEPGDVDVDRLGHVGCETLAIELPQVVLEDPAGLHTGRLAHDAEWNRDMDLLISPNGEEVDVHEPAPDVIALNVSREREVLGPVDDKVDEDIRAGSRVEEMEKLARVDGERERVHPVAIQDRGHSAGGAQLPRGALAGSLSCLGDEPLFHRRPMVPTRPRGKRSLVRLS
jgi:hypothetical protein